MVTETSEKRHDDALGVMIPQLPVIFLSLHAYQTENYSNGDGLMSNLTVLMKFNVGATNEEFST